MAQVYLTERVLAVWDTGIGKTHLGMASPALLFEDGLIDHVLLCCEPNKLGEWLDDFASFTRLTTTKYYGTVPKRTKLRTDLAQVIVSTYETFKNDCAKKAQVKSGKRYVNRLVPGPLLEALEGQRVLIVYDEVSAKLGNRGSDLFKAHEFLIKRLHEAKQCRVLAMTATPIQRSPETYYNLGRLIAPDLVGTVASFEKDHTLGNGTKDDYGRYLGFKNLTPEQTYENWVTPLATKMKPVMMRKRKTDEDVIEQFPTTQEDFKHVELGDLHQDFYDTVLDTFEEDTPGLFVVKRQIAAHPMGLLHSDGQLAREIARTVGEAGLRAMGSAKEDRLVEYLTPIVKGQGAQVVVFSFFGPTVLPYLQEALQSAGMSCALHYGGMNYEAKEKAKRDFRAGDYEIFLTSDAGARGINLPEALYVVEYEMALTHSNRVQRLNRIHRIDSKHPSVTFMSFIAKNTVEEQIASGMLKRNEWADQLLDDDDPGENFVTAQQRKLQLNISRRASA